MASRTTEESAGIEIDFEQYIDKLFRKDIGPARSAMAELQIECDTPAQLFELLLLIFNKGLRKAANWKPGQNLQLAEVSPEHVEDIIKRFAMIGFTLNIARAEAPKRFIIDNSAYLDKTRLADMTFTLVQNEIVYRVSFDYV